MSASKETSPSSSKSDVPRDKYIFLPPTDSDEEAECNIALAEINRERQLYADNQSPRTKARIQAVGDHCRGLLEKWTNRLHAYQFIDQLYDLPVEDEDKALTMPVSRKTKSAFVQMKDDYEKCGFIKKSKIAHEDINQNEPSSS